MVPQKYPGRFAVFAGCRRNMLGVVGLATAAASCDLLAPV
jgi:hypothetical protein